ncbi:MFS transporter [Micromonospora acroterricola]|uniref:MFS transporter n=1 Tax=Micromonospora acroterricola TaxID=2202421 RepID=A0A317D441_9ACTN|nr:MFS transporter [Micromonospora acroterricola]PWR09479.1 MFS transporter [Micromonospora acroterricola]
MTSSALGPDFRLLWSATVSSRFGDALRTPALALLAATLTRDPRIIAAVTVAGQLPPLLFGLLGGVYADRWDRRRTMALVDGVRAAVVAALAVAVALDRAGVLALLVAAFLLATLGTLFDAASFALLPALVPPAALPRANGRLQAGTAVAGGFLGAPAAGVLFAVAPAVPFALDAVTFAVAAVLILSLTPSPAPDVGMVARRRPVWGEIVEGVRWLRTHRTLWRVTLLAAASNLAISGLLAVLVLYALDVLRVPPAGYGLFAAGAILGGLAGALGAGRLAARLGTVPALRAVLAAQTVALTGFALARHPVAGGLALAVFAAGTVVWNSLCASYGQHQVPAGLLGRVGAAQRMVGLLTAPVGAALAGLVAAAYGTVPVAGAAAGTFALVTFAAWRSLRPTTSVPPTAPVSTPIRS